MKATRLPGWAVTAAILAGACFLVIHLVLTESTATVLAWAVPVLVAGCVALTVLVMWRADPAGSHHGGGDGEAGSLLRSKIAAAREGFRAAMRRPWRSPYLAPDEKPFAPRGRHAVGKGKAEPLSLLAAPLPVTPQHPDTHTPLYIDLPPVPLRGPLKVTLLPTSLTADARLVPDQQRVSDLFAAPEVAHELPADTFNYLPEEPEGCLYDEADDWAGALERPSRRQPGRFPPIAAFYVRARVAGALVAALKPRVTAYPGWKTGQFAAITAEMEAAQ
jgi:hypothetical protein